MAQIVPETSLMPEIVQLDGEANGSATTSEHDLKAIDEKGGKQDFNSLEDDEPQAREGGDPRTKVIRTGLDVSEYLLSDRDDGDAAITFRALVLGTVATVFQAVMNQLYLFKPTAVTISGAFLILIVLALGNAWYAFLPTSKRFRERWGDEPDARAKRWTIKTIDFINPGPFGLKEHAIAAITANSGSNAAEALFPFTVQKLFYDQNLTPGLVIMATLSIGLFGYGLTGIFRPMTIYPSSMVYYSNIPLVQAFQRLHWDRFNSSKVLRMFWYAFIVMALYEIIPSYMFLTLVAVSIPCLASMNAPGARQQLLTNLFGGSSNNEGLGMFSICLDWQYIQSVQSSLPLIQQANSWIGLSICYVVFIALYYGNAFSARDLPFLSTRLLTDEGTAYPTTSVFVNGILDERALKEIGLPRLTATYAWAMMVGNAAIGALVMHCLLFWRKDVVRSLREAWKGTYSDRHQRAMSKYREVSWKWFAALLVLAFALGLAVNLSENTTLPVWAYIVALLVGSAIAPFSTLLYGRFGNGIATNQLMKMIAGVAVPGRPIANLYFTAWSHCTIAQSLNLAADLKMGTYLKIPPFAMFATQIWGTVLGIFINYAVMITVVENQRENLLSANGDGVWTGQYFQSESLQAAVWALSKELYAVGKPYFIVPLGVLFGAALVIVHSVITKFKPKIWRLNLSDLNIPVICMYSGWMGYNQTQSSVILSTVLVGVFVQFYLRNYHPRIFQDYSYIIAAGMDGGVLLVIFILSFAVFGAAGVPHPFPTWAGNPAGFADHCPDPSS